MGWRDLLSANESLILPWTGNNRLRKDERIWTLEGKRPEEYCWGRFFCKTNRTAFFEDPAEPQWDSLGYFVFGYLVGNRLVPNDARVDPNPLKIADQTEEVFLIDPGIDRFARVSAGRIFHNGPLIFRSEEFPLGAEDNVRDAFLNQEDNLSTIKCVTPALEAAFHMEVWQRREAQRRRVELELRRAEEALKRQKEERRQNLTRQLGDGSIRRELALEDFTLAAQAALAVGGATYLDHRKSVQANEMVVTFRLSNRRFECTCDARTLRIIDSGICLKAENEESGFDYGTKGDTWFTLESLPVVILEAIREGKLVIFRHVA